MDIIVIICAVVTCAFGAAIFIFAMKDDEYHIKSLIKAIGYFAVAVLTFIDCAFTKEGNSTLEAAIICVSLLELASNISDFAPTVKKIFKKRKSK